MHGSIQFSIANCDSTANEKKVVTDLATKTTVEYNLKNSRQPIYLTILV